MVKFDLHIHSCYSHNLYGTKLFSPPSISTPEDIVKIALSRGINVIAVTDHDNILGSLKALEVARSPKYKGKILVIPGVEVTSKNGHIVAYNVYDDIPKNLSAEKTIKLIKQKGGFAVAAHPFNIKYSIKRRFADKLLQDFFAFEIFNSHSLKNKYAKNYIENHKLAFTVGSDAHALKEIGLCYGVINKNIDSVEDFLCCIRDRQVDSFQSYNGRLLVRLVPVALKSFFYWKTRQVKHLFNKSVFLPYA